MSQRPEPPRVLRIEGRNWDNDGRPIRSAADKRATALNFILTFVVFWCGVVLGAAPCEVLN